VVLTGKQRNEGFEATLGGALAKGWNAYINFTHLTDATLQNQTSSGAAGARAGLTPRNQASVWTTYAFTPHWGIGGGVMGNSRQYTSFTNAVVLPGYARTDLMGWYENAGYRVQLNVENALRRHYYATANGDNQIMPGAPTTMMLTLRTSF
jgi:catecholate siderophore receptor